MNAGTDEKKPLLRLDAVKKSYGKQVALNQLSFNIDPGEFVALLGPNGAGKTTLFQLLTGLFACDEGGLSIGGYDIATNAVAVLKKIGVVFQQATLDLDMSVQANLRFHAMLRGMSATKTKQRIHEELSRVGLTQDSKRLCRELSGGNRRKVELARALLDSPDLLLMDEATVGLDPASRRDLLKNVNTLCQEEGMAVLWATHLVDEAHNADRIVILHHGKILQQGTAQDIVASTGESTLSDAFIALTAADKTRDAS